ncbi:unnamed protein product [Tenebrio molitor]|nr:unnamed protein product [Tenebrio molitor]
MQKCVLDLCQTDYSTGNPENYFIYSVVFIMGKQFFREKFKKFD